ncbi:MAG: EscU/YscU/HrcU family type III secretion system export apparatus switch protein [Planctomyces sp.]|nr:EscU/YscU/HrcU family type III secretion system export apparatus switch protein [Planctomyces sp.]
MSESDRTLPPSARRLAQVREEGSAPRSAALTGGAVLFAAAALLAFAAPQTLNACAEGLERALRARPLRSLSIDSAAALVRESVLTFILASGWFLAGIWSAALAVAWIQVGPLWAPKAVQPSWSRLAAPHGVGGLPSRNGLASVGWNAVAAGGAFGAAAIWLIWNQNALLAAPEGPVARVASAALSQISQAWLALAGAVFLLSLGEAGLRRIRFERSLWMTPEQQRDERDSRPRPTRGRASR